MRIRHWCHQNQKVAVYHSLRKESQSDRAFVTLSQTAALVTLLDEARLILFSFENDLSPGQFMTIKHKNNLEIVSTFGKTAWIFHA